MLRTDSLAADRPGESMHDTVAIEAVGELGRAVHEAALCPPPAGTETLVSRLGADQAALDAVPALRAAHDHAVARRERALDRIWPRSSQSRPKGNGEILQTCAAISYLAALPEGRVATRLATLPGGAADRLDAEARHVGELESRLRELGVAEEAGELWDAAALVDDMAREHGTRSPAEAREALDLANRDADRLSEAARLGGRLAEASGLPRATAGQLLALGRCLAAAPRPWIGGLASTPELEAAAAKLGDSSERYAKAREGAASLDARYGSAWRSEDPGKLAAAARILATDGDRRQASASQYADSMNVQEDRPRVLNAMARTGAALATPPVPPALAGLLSPLWSGGDPDPSAAAEHLTAVMSWRKGFERSESLRMAVKALDALDRHARDSVLQLVEGYASAAGTLTDRDARRPPRDLAAEARARADSLGGMVARLDALSGDTVQKARRVARILKERRQAYERMAADPAYPMAGAADPAELALAHAWGEALGALLPTGLDPRAPGMAETLARVSEEATEAASSLASLLARVSGICGSEDVSALELLAESAVRAKALEAARGAVTRSDAWDLVARLEEEGIEPTLWADAIPGLMASPEPERTEPEPARVEATAVPFRARVPTPPPAFPFHETARWARTPIVRDREGRAA